MDETQNDAPFVAFYDMRAVTFVPPDEMAYVTIAGLQWFILIPRLNHTGSHRPIDSHSIPVVYKGGFWLIPLKQTSPFIISPPRLTLS